MIPYRSGVALGALFAFSLLVPSLAQAQSPNPRTEDLRSPVPVADVPDRRQDVLQRLDTAEPPAGYRVGGFKMNPRLSGGITYDDNIFATRNNKKSDLIGNVGVGLRAQTEMTQHFFGIDAAIDANKYADNSREDFWHGMLNARGRYDVDRSTNFGAEASVQRLTEPREAPDDLGSQEPLEFFVYRGAVNGAHEFGAFLSRGELGVQRLQYDDAATSNGTRISTDDRERNEYFFNGQLGYRYLGPEQVYLRLNLNERDYDQEVDNSSFRRGSKGYRAEVGATADLGGLIFADLSIGYQEQDYDDARFGSPGKPVWAGSLLWNPTRLTSVKAEGKYEFAESFNTGSPGYWRSLYTLTVAHELRFNLVGFVRGVYQEREFDRLAREDEVYGGDIGLRYRLDRGMFLDGEYHHRKQDTTTAGATGGYSRNLALVRLRRTF